MTVLRYTMCGIRGTIRCFYTTCLVLCELKLNIAITSQLYKIQELFNVGDVNFVTLHHPSYFLTKYAKCDMRVTNDKRQLPVLCCICEHSTTFFLTPSYSM